MSKTEHPPSISETAFDCPHCGAYAQQDWYCVHVAERPDKCVEPFYDAGTIRRFAEQQEWDTEKSMQNFILTQVMRTNGEVFIDNKNGAYRSKIVQNIYLSKCFRCDEIAVWKHKTLVHPAAVFAGPEPGADMPDDVRRDFQEAQKVVKDSPRSACALLRLAVQKLCIALGQQNQNLDSAIAALAANGLPGKVQKSLDIVRVIGNQAVHPGEYNSEDDAETAVRLFGLVNIIVEQMITAPKAVDEMYEKLPANKREAIERRDAGASGDDPEGGS